MTGDAAAEARLQGNSNATISRVPGLRQSDPIPINKIMISKKPLYTVPVASTSFATQAYFDGQMDSIRFGYGKDGAQSQGGIKFNHVLTVRTRSERCCTVWHIDGAYDTSLKLMGLPG